VPFFADNFTDTDAVRLEDHTPDTGTSWTRLWGSAAGLQWIITSNRAGSETDVNDGVIYTADATPPSADYDVIFTVVGLGASVARPMYIFVRVQDVDNLYGVKLAIGTSVCQLYKKVSGTWTALGTAFDEPANGSVCKLEIIGGALKFYDDGVEVASATDGDITVAGKAGIGSGGGAELVDTTDDAHAANIIDTLTANDLAGGAAQLVVQDATLALAADSVALTQHNALVVADALLALAAESPALTQHNLLAVADALLALGVDSPALTQHNALAVADALLALAADGVVLTQHNVIAVADAVLALVADGVVLVLPGVLEPQDATVALVVDNVALVQHGVLVVQDATIGLTADTVDFAGPLPIPSTGGGLPRPMRVRWPEEEIEAESEELLLLL